MTTSEAEDVLVHVEGKLMQVQDVTKQKAKALGVRLGNMEAKVDP